jgi:iron-regulated transporter 1
VRTIALILFSSSVGRWVDQSPNRLKTLLSTISVNRTSVLCASVLWFFIIQPENGDDLSLFSGSRSLGISPSFWKDIIFAVVIAMGILEGLSASGNMLSMERDWIVTAASPNGQPYDLTHLNSSMRRIDLICKLIAPIAISIVISMAHIRIGVVVVSIMSVISWAVECWCARRVWFRNPRLQAPKTVANRDSPDSITSPGPASFLSRASQSIWTYAADFRMYFSSPVWIPSLCLALLHISVLAYNATFITYLLAMGFSLDLITFARAAGSMVEISSTVVTPFGVKYLGNPKTHGRHNHSRGDVDGSADTLLERPHDTEEIKTEMGLERLGLWGISFQLINLVTLAIFPAFSYVPLLTFL